MLRKVFLITAALAIGFACANRSFGQLKAAGDEAELISFKVAFASEDPFDPSNQAGKKYQARRGEVVRVQVIATPKKGFHTYPVTYRIPTQQTDFKGQQTKLIFGELNGVVFLPPIHESEPDSVDEGPGIGVLREHKKPFFLAQDFVVLPDAKPGAYTLPVTLDAYVCNDQFCRQVQVSYKSELDITSDAPLPLSEQLKTRLQVKQPDTALVPVEATPSRDIRSIGLISGTAEDYKKSMDDIAARIVFKTDKGVSATPTSTQTGLLGFMLAGIFWGAVSLITPCVFPMIPITVSFFLKQSEKAHHRPVTMALVYSGTIVVVLTLAAAFLLSAFRWLSIHPIMNYGLGALFIFFALSLFGMYDIELPSGLARFTSSKEGKGGMVGTVFMALTFTIISFACVAPFLGGFGGTAGMSERPWWHNILGGLAFSATFASPFFFLALFPTLLRSMPKSGSWLNSVKVVMGFLELAAALKFFRAAELVQSGKATFFTFDLILGIWIALCVLCVLYLLGVYRLPHDTPEEHIRVPSLLFASVFLGLAFYLCPALFKLSANGEMQRPGGTIYAWVDSFLLPDGRSGKEATGNLSFAIAQAEDARAKTGEPKRIFLDFTGINCTNCAINERDVFAKPEFQKLLRNFIVVQLYTDTVPTELYAHEVIAKSGSARQKADADVNDRFQSKVFNSSTLPYYAILEPLPDGKIEVLGTNEEGRIINQPAFEEFLRKPK